MSGLGSLVEAQSVRVETPFGATSADIIVGDLGERRVAFLKRHGEGHRLIPSEINFRANIFALKLLGVSQILSLSAVGSLQEQFHPGEFVIPSQFFDFTRHRADAFLVMVWWRTLAWQIPSAQAWVRFSKTPAPRKASQSIAVAPTFALKAPNSLRVLNRRFSGRGEWM